MRIVRLAALAWLVCAVAVGADAGAANLKVSGYALRNWLNFQMFRQLHFRAIGGE